MVEMPACLDLFSPTGPHSYFAERVILVRRNPALLKTIRMQFYGMTMEIYSHTGSNVTRVNKVRAGSLPLQRPVKSKLGSKGNCRMFLKLAEWNIRTLMDNARSKRPDTQGAKAPILGKPDMAYCKRMVPIFHLYGYRKVSPGWTTFAKICTKYRK